MDVIAGEQALRDSLIECFAWAEHALLISCYTDARWMRSISRLATRCDSGELSVRVLLGDDPKFEDGTELLAWQKRRRKHSVAIHRTTLRSRRKLHAKLYLFQSGSRRVALMGSSNLTRPGIAGSRGGNVEANVRIQTDDGQLADLWNFAEAQWAMSRPLGTPAPPPPPRPETYEDYLLRRIAAGRFWLPEFRQGGSVLSLPRSTFDLERRSVGAGSLQIVEDGQVQWHVLSPADLNKVRAAHNRAREALKTQSLDAGPWGFFITEAGRTAWATDAKAATGAFDAFADELLARAAEPTARLKELKTAAVSAYRKLLKDPKARFPRKKWLDLERAARDALRAFADDTTRQPKLLFHLNPIHVARLKSAVPGSAEAHAYRRLIQALLLGSLRTTRERFLDGASREDIQRLMLVHDARMDAYLNALPDGGIVPPNRLTDSEARRKAKRDLRTLNGQGHKTAAKLCAWAGRWTEWKP